MRVACFGGSFDPPHVGHVLAASYALATEAIDRVLVIPVYAHAFSKRLNAFEQRVALAKLAMQPLTNVEISEIERELPTPSYTLQTLRELQHRHPDWQLRLLLGSDAFAGRDQWRGFDEIAALAPPIVLPRADSSSPAEAARILPEVSSSEVRELLLARPSSRSARRLPLLLPRAVLTHIETHGLYLRPVC